LLTICFEALGMTSFCE